MQLSESAINGIRFYYRDGFSDLKTFNEVIGKDTYQKKGMKIEAGEHWMDCGGNVGAFTLLACSLGASVTVFEPDPFNCKMIERNLKLNGFNANIVQAALVHKTTKSVTLFIGNNNNVWRNSIVKRWNDKGLKVPALNFETASDGFDCCKMDIEGAEMPILENTQKIFDKLVYEWSFDIDPSLPRFWNIIEKQQNEYSEIANIGNTAKFITRDYDTWQNSWFPACTNIFAFNKPKSK